MLNKYPKTPKTNTNMGNSNRSEGKEGKVSVGSSWKLYVFMCVFMYVVHVHISGTCMSMYKCNVRVRMRVTPGFHPSIVPRLIPKYADLTGLQIHSSSHESSSILILNFYESFGPNNFPLLIRGQLAFSVKITLNFAM